MLLLNLNPHQNHGYFKGYFPDDNLPNGVNARQRAFNQFFEPLEGLIWRRVSHFDR